MQKKIFIEIDTHFVTCMVGDWGEIEWTNNSNREMREIF